jgi:hypothetical protein
MVLHFGTAPILGSRNWPAYKHVEDGRADNVRKAVNNSIATLYRSSPKLIIYTEEFGELSFQPRAFHKVDKVFLRLMDQEEARLWGDVAW